MLEGRGFEGFLICYLIQKKLDYETKKKQTRRVKDGGGTPSQMARRTNQAGTYSD
jgi:hypothetical protein